jgi:hypothetical protein
MKPDANEFARTVLFNLAALTAEVHELKCLLADAVAEIKRLPVEQVRNQYSERAAEHADELYRQYLEDAKIPVPEDPDPGPEEDQRG